MKNSRVLEIMNKKEICDVYYEEHLVWIQEVENEIAKVGFIDMAKEKNINIADLYEKN